MIGLQYIIDGRVMEGSNKSFSHSDPGGCESAAIKLTHDNPPRPGAPAVIFDGMTPLFIGSVEEPGASNQRGTTDTNVGIVGAVSKFQNERVTAIYIDRDLSHWIGPSIARQLILINNGYSIDGSVEARYDVASGPVLVISRSDQGGVLPEAEAWYDAGERCAIERISFQYNFLNMESLGVDGLDANIATGSDDDDASNTLAELVSLSRTPGYVPYPVDRTWIRGRRFTVVGHGWPSTTEHDSGVQRSLSLQNLTVIGTHGLDVDGSASDGTLNIKLGLIVGDAVARSGIGGTCKIDKTSIPMYSLAYIEAVAPRQITDDAVKYSGFHFGVWPGSALDPLSPLTLFQAPPSRPTAIVNYRDLESPDITERMSGMNRQANVRYSLAGTGKSGSVIVQRDHQRLGIGEGGTLDVDAGIVGSVDVAETYGLLALATDQFQSRAAGSVVLPPCVLSDGGSLKPSHHLRPGVDRLRIAGLPTSTSFIADAGERGDTFRISRLSVDEQDGRLTTTVELDQGADLIEVLQARFAKNDVTGQLGG